MDDTTRNQMTMACHNAAAGRLRMVAKGLLRDTPSYDRMMVAVMAHEAEVARIQKLMAQ